MKLYIFSSRHTLNIYHLFVFGVRILCASCFGRDLPVIRKGISTLNFQSPAALSVVLTPAMSLVYEY